MTRIMNRILLTGAVLIGFSGAVMDAASAHDRRPIPGQQWSEAGWQVEEVAPNTPAARAGLRAGNRITAIDGGSVNSFDDIMRRVDRSGRSVVIDVERAGRHRRLRIVPRALTRLETDDYVAPSRRMLGVVHTQRGFVLRPGTGANDVFIAPPIPPEPLQPPMVPN
jgi:S1-C subfamily serine protease